MALPFMLASFILLAFYGALTIRQDTRLVRSLYTLLQFLLLASLASAQVGISPQFQPESPKRDGNAVAAFRSAIEALGGEAAWSNLYSVTMTGEAQSGSSSSTRQLRWIDDLTKTFPEFRRETSTANGSAVWTSGHGKSAYSDGTATHSVPLHVMLANVPYHLPAVLLLKELNDSRYSIEWIGSEEVNGTSAIHVRSSRNDDKANHSITPQDWYFDPISVLPIKVDYKLPRFTNALKTTVGSVKYDKYQSQSGMLFPFVLISSIDTASSTITITVSSYSLNSSVVASDFELPGGNR